MSGEHETSGPDIGPGPLSSRVMQLVFLIDASGSMLPEGKIQSLNTAIEESLPHLRRSVAELPELTASVRVIAFSDNARWIVETPCPVEDFRWVPVEADVEGLTETGAAIELARSTLAGVSHPGALPPGLVLVSDGMPTDTVDPEFAIAIERLDTDPLFASATRLAVGIGSDADRSSLAQFSGADGPAPIRADDPQQLMVAMRAAATSLLRSASELSP